MVISQHFLEDRTDGILLSYKGNSVDILIQLSGYFNHGYLPCEGLKTQSHKPEASSFQVWCFPSCGTGLKYN